MTEKEKSIPEDISDYFEKGTPSLKKRFKDLISILSKCKYHKEKCVENYPEFLKKMNKILSKEAIIIANESNLKIRPGGKTETKIEASYFLEVNHPFFFEFDSYMVDMKRGVEYILKLLYGVVLGKTKDDLSVENFFKGLLETENYQSKLVREIKKDTAFAKFLLRSWDDWIEEVNKYRTNTVHKSIPNRFLIKSDTFWSSVTTADKPSKVIIKELLKKHGGKLELEKMKEEKSKLDNFCESILIWIWNNYIAQNIDAE